MFEKAIIEIDQIEVPLDKFKWVESNIELPKYKHAYSDVSEEVIKLYSAEEKAERKAFLDFCDLQNKLIKHIAKSIQQNKYWAIDSKLLDFSLASLKLLDKHQNSSVQSLQGSMKKDFVKKWIVPELYCYVLATILANIPEEKYLRIYHKRIDKLVFRPNCGSRIIEPFKYMELCVFAGFPISELVSTLQRVSKKCQ